MKCATKFEWNDCVGVQETSCFTATRTMAESEWPFNLKVPQKTQCKHIFGSLHLCCASSGIFLQLRHCLQDMDTNLQLCKMSVVM